MKLAPLFFAAMMAALTFVSHSVTTANDLPRGVADWNSELGNQRARILVGATSDAVRVHIPWRRRDAWPERKGLIVVSATDGKPIKNVYPININRESGDIVFQPQSGPGEYIVYYMPFHTAGSPYFPVVTYPPSKNEADASWLERIGVKTGTWETLPEAGAIEIQARREWNRSDPMEVIATAEETDRLRKGHLVSPFLVFPEDRSHPIRMTQDLPLSWIERGPSDAFSAEARRGEFLSFQLGIWAPNKSLKNVVVSFGVMAGSQRNLIPASAFRCFNQGGVDWLGRRFTKKISIPKGEVAPIWLGVQIPKNLKPGHYNGLMVVDARGVAVRQIRFNLLVKPEVAEDGGDKNPFDMTRLRWLDSTIGLDDEVVAPYTPVKATKQTMTCLGREVKFGPTGFPASLASNGNEILSRPISLKVDLDGKSVTWKSSTPITSTRPAAITTSVVNKSGPMTMTCQSKMEADGYINYRVSLSSKSRVSLSDVRLEIPYCSEVAKFLMGMGRKGGVRPSEWKWDWNKGYANNMVWIGSVDAGLQCKLKDVTDSWDLFQLSHIPDAWSNRGKGGCLISDRRDGTVLLKAFSGARELTAGQTLNFNFGLLITPVKPLDSAHWSQRYDHEFIAPEKAKANGATVINVHQGNELNPNINYPFLTVDKMSAYVKKAHSLGLKVKIYYTVRELSNRVAEIWPLRSLGHEIFTDGVGGGDSWLQEHLVSHYKPAWHTPLSDGSIDAAITTTGLSRWHNYYLEGLGWLIKNVGIDGLYLDGIGYDREIMKRVRKVMDRSRAGCLIDFHCGNSFQPEYGMNSCANQFMEHFPYMNSLWFGEGYDYNETPDYWLTEISGIPYGMYGEMLQDHGNPWRGMIYGMTARYYDGADPKPIWDLWDSFGIAKAKMLGYWSPKCPVRTTDPNVLATAYVRGGKTLVSIASWAKSEVSVKLKVDWKAVGLNPARVSLVAPAIKGFQSAAKFTPDSEILVKPGQGWLIVLTAQ